MRFDAGGDSLSIHCLRLGGELFHRPDAPNPKAQPAVRITVESSEIPVLEMTRPRPKLSLRADRVRSNYRVKLERAMS